MKVKFTTTAAAIIILALAHNGCNNAPTENESQEDISDGTSVEMEGLSIVDQNCISCHSPKGGADSRIAPPLAAIKQHYFKEGMSESEFVEQISTFLNSPSIEKSKMPMAVEKFGLMPNLGFSEEQYKAVATYLYQSELENPDWFEKDHKRLRKRMGMHSSQSTTDYVKEGQNIALSTKAVLGKNLLTAIQSKGTDKALEFCNTKAIPLTDSMSTVLNAGVRRVSDNNRNPDNLANATELEYIRKAKQQIAESGKATPEVHEEAGKMIGYYPIMTNAMCLQCHGKPQVDINENTLAALQNLYPDDKATGYGENQLRGIWVIEMDK